MPPCNSSLNLSIVVAGSLRSGLVLPQRTCNIMTLHIYIG